MSQALTTQEETQAVVLSRSPFQAYMSQDNEGPYERKHIISPYIRAHRSLSKVFEVTGSDSLMDD